MASKKLRVRKGFWPGIVFALACENFYQDYLGQTAYLEEIRAHWWHTNVWVWVAVGLLALSWGMKAKSPHPPVPPGRVESGKFGG